MSIGSINTDCAISREDDRKSSPKEKVDPFLKRKADLESRAETLLAELNNLVDEIEDIRTGGCDDGDSVGMFEFCWLRHNCNAALPRVVR